MPWTEVAVERTISSRSPDKNAAGRVLSYRDALREALGQALKRDPGVFIMGEGVDDPAGVFGSTAGLREEFPSRVLDTPIAENGLTGFAVGAALAGMRPVLVHMRMDFLPLSFDQILNHAAKLCYMSGGRSHVPLVIRAVIGRGWGSAAQHSQSLQAMFMQMPGIKVVAPSSAYDAKGLLLSSIADGNPVIFIEHRWLYDVKGGVPKKEYLVPIGKGVVRRTGKDVTVVAVSLMVNEAVEAAKELKDGSIDIEIIDPRSLVPFDEKIVVDSVKKTGRLVIADMGWRSGGAAEIILGRIHDRIRRYLKADVQIVALPDTPTPASHRLEKAFYKNSGDIAKAARKAYGLRKK
ncbi:MAG: transketolase C-terminal domain-containing protein [Candidatus Omnitrophica bacterium]|nr:transketolase C-terminal domain-containing protein [Candidatus Omnitrophota bacterium]MDD5310185.1 transketolase C-terminal domain-containing protein [Candidatus Omnitrophota bacterium]